MSKDEYPSIFSPQMEAVVFIIFQILNPRIFPSFRWRIFGPLCEILFVEAKKVLLNIILKRKNLANIYLSFFTLLCSIRLRYVLLGSHICTQRA